MTEGKLPAGPGYLPLTYQLSLGFLYQEEEIWFLASGMVSPFFILAVSPEITPELLPRRPRLLILVNPFGGRGLAWQRCMDHVVPMISEAGLSFNLIQTGRGFGVEWGGILWDLLEGSGRMRRLLD